MTIPSIGSDCSCAGSQLSRTVRQGAGRAAPLAGRVRRPRRRGGGAREARAQARGPLADAPGAVRARRARSRRTSRNRPLAPADAVGHDHLSWLDRMVRTTAPLIERMTLIWHDWFATSNLGVASQQLMLDQVDMFRGNALGSFTDLLLGVTTGPGDARLAERQPERQEQPNENYAREMMELFTLGANRGAYTETDVREQARALTGWTGRRRQPAEHRLHLQPDPARHRQQDDLRQDRATTPGRTRASSASTTRCTRRSSSTKLWSYFVPTTPDSATVDGARRRATRDRQGAAGRRGDPAAPGLLRGPAHGQAAGRAQRGPAADARPLHRHLGLVDRSAQSAGQQLFYPPDVGGWDDTRWLDTATFRARWFIAALVQGRLDADRQPERPGAARRPRARVLGHADGHAARRRALLEGVRGGAARSGRSTPATSRPRCAGSIASSPDLQTLHELLRLQPHRDPPPRGGEAGAGLPEIEPGMPMPAGTGMTRRDVRLAHRRARARRLRRRARCSQRALDDGIAAAAPRPRRRTRRCSSRSS